MLNLPDTHFYFDGRQNTIWVFFDIYNITLVKIMMAVCYFVDIRQNCKCLIVASRAFHFICSRLVHIIN